MPSYVQHLRLTASGTLGPATAPVEIWAWRLNLSDPNTSGIAFEDLATHYAATIQAFHADALSTIWSGARLREVKLARIGTDGLYMRDPVKKPLDVPGGVLAGAPANPFQVTLAVSLTTAKFGPRGRGRVHLPCPMLGQNDSGLIAEADRDALQTRFASMLNALNDIPNAIPPEPRVTIASTGGKSLVPANYDVTGCRVGRVVDTIRSRRNKLSEMYDPVTAVV